ncbi:chromate transporter [Persicobacter sp. CCB-QB2]|uniref:chromate transporter n=1 Tax=Persicobacter sp. CCB-QB2 TaxID=1561025 RepID=UPI0006A98DA0|nr:chromate transporter [Persicobacter sp. CCB-QB2]
MKFLFDLFWTFFKLGAVTFGGGYAMIAILEDIICTQKQWLEKEELLDIIAIAQMTPGTIAINAATFVGFKYKGVGGAIAASIGLVMPSVIIVTVIVLLFGAELSNPLVQAAFTGIRCCVVALIMVAVVRMYKDSVKENWGRLAFLISVLLMVFSGLNPIGLIVAGAAIAMLTQLIIPKWFSKKLA